MPRTRPAWHLAKSPLVTALAQVRFSAVLEIARDVPKIQEQLRHMGYPVYEEQPQTEVVLDPERNISATATTRWFFSSKDQRWSVVLTQEFVAIQTTAYGTFDDFAERLEQILRVVFAEARVELYERVGLRYINQVVPDAKGTVQEYLSPGLVGITSIDLATRGLVTRSARVQALVIVSTAWESTLAIRAAGLPPNERASPFGVTNAEAFAVSDKDTALLDIDHFIAKRGDASIEDILSLLWRLHDDIDLAFEASVTAHALAQWGKHDG